MIKIDLDQAAGSTSDRLVEQPWDKKEFKDWNEAMPELLNLYHSLVIFKDEDEEDSFNVYLYNGYME